MKSPGGGMAKELAEAPAAVQAQARELTAPLAALMARLARRSPNVVVTCARGSSAHAATFAKHLIERYLGIPVAAAAPNIASVYHQRLALKDQLFLAISQSGSSDDLIEAAAAARAANAVTAAIVNDPKIIVADEPTGDLDRKSADDILNLLETLNTEFKKTILMVTHDPAAAERAKITRRLDKGSLL